MRMSSGHARSKGRRWLRYLGWGALAFLGLVLIFVLVRAVLIWPRADLEPILIDEPLELPTHLAQMPDGSGEMAVTEKAGRILRFRPDARKAAGVLIDLTSKVVIEGWEDGLLAIAFHPHFAENGQFFVSYNAGNPRRLIFSRFVMDPATRTADPAGEVQILVIHRAHPNHNGGSLAFAHDGTLFIGTGDGKLHDSSQDRTSLLGKILRIDVDRRENGRPYAIPPDNPFIKAQDGTRPEIWAYGLRNPWRISVDRQTGELWVGDVGGADYEEVNRIEKGGNYGWRDMEGQYCHTDNPGCDQSGMIPPVGSFSHVLIRSLIGGYVYRGSRLIAAKGEYVFGSYFRGIYSMPIGDTGVVTMPDVLIYRPRSQHKRNEGKEIRISSLAEDLDGELYVVDLNGGLYRIVEK